MQFYTNVTPWGNTLLVREYVNGERVNRKVKYSPTLFCKVIKETNYKTLDGQNVTPIKHETIKEAKEWLKSYEDQPHLVFGNTTFQYNYIADSYPNYVKWDIDKPNGTPRKVLNVDKIKSLGWEPKISLRQGIESTYEWFSTSIFFI